ncbi:hypothetical protein H3302_18615 [Pseudoalteromonas sp. MT33b]|uniref:Imm27 family immunity protein n=1 Tax=Pseudoalteromonas sp. MT33b TaxID=2759705 RepID=UPI0015FA758A|nr:Imm27 family immunity protein [Pseudoalteromonas sp. MT33b]QMW16296.1 hypothetical protein H3302_18615 [Pseudoalteromonas sp. MT33b]
MNLKKDENILVGKHIFLNGKVVADETAQRIDYLKNNVMSVVAYSHDGWSTLLRDPNDGRLWELIYDDSSSHGGGAPSLICITLDNAKNKYKFK